MSNYLPNLATVATFADAAIWKHPNHEQDEEVVLDSACTFPMVAGTVLAKVSATGRFKAYSDTGSGGVEVALGILNETVDLQYVGSTLQHVQSYMGCAGTCYTAACTGLDAAAIADLPRIKFV